ncbi:unnamed protein product [Lactuca virosa]|uniref:HAT C-terminal dimerisation domain-containing protein n=1 Tax=Lactuca virosa TaxID=75947 RepID=A0AAU9PD29_9ASTR|nr:unnamed protein product [Lactuca virosa]
MEGNSSHASVNPPTTTPTNTRSDANTTSVNGNKDMAWEWGIQKDPLNKQNIWYTLCDKRVCGGITRLKEHLTHTGGNVAACSKVTTEITKKVLESMKEKDKKKKERKRTTEILRSTSCIDLSENEDEQDDTPQVKKRKFVSSSNVRGPIDDVYKSDHGKGKQTTLDKNNPIKEKLKKVAWKKIAVWAYSVGYLSMPYMMRVSKMRSMPLENMEEKEATIATALTEARAIVVYIYNHGRILNMMRKLTKNRELHRSCVTRFATQFYTLQSVHENRHHLQVLFVSEQWRKSDFAKKAPGKRVEKIVAKQSFWDGVYLACQIYAPLVDIVRLVDTEERPCMGYIYDAMSRAQDQISKNLTDGNNDKKDWQVEFCLSFKQDVTTNFFIPYIQIMTGLYVAIDRLVPDEDENDTLRLELNLYIDLNGQFGSPAAKRSMTKVAPYIWWRSYGIDTPILRKFAITLHSKKRNCLLQQKLNELVFILYNTRLQKRFMSLQNKSLDPILLRDVEENDDWTIPTEDELQDFVDGGDDLLWSDVQEAMGANEDAHPNIRRKRERYRDDDDDIVDVGNDFDEEVNALDDVDSDAEPVPCD